jgi:hypothetical protein
MPSRLACLVFALGLALAAASDALAKTIRFSGYTFEVKQGRERGPGPNDWAPSQVGVDREGRLHLRFSERNGRWVAAEVSSVERFGFGTYEMVFIGDIGGLDRNVVFGFFNYPGSELGPDVHTEIDIEFARWGSRTAKPLNFTVWPPDDSVKNAHRQFHFRKGERRSLHRFTWERDHVHFYSAELNDRGRPVREVEWTFLPGNPARRIGDQPMPVHFNLWGFRGGKPSDGMPVEVIVESFRFTPSEAGGTVEEGVSR